MIQWMMILIAVLILVLLVVFIILRKGQKVPTDYHNLFVIGIIWVGAGIPLGITSNNYGLFIIGLVLMAVGLLHRKEWKKNIADRKKKWEKMGKEDRKRLMWFKWILMGILLLGLIVLGVFYYFNK
jgi:cell division protein FtsW (lipid II flippase)